MDNFMSSIVLSGDTSGTITLSAPAVAGTQTASLPLVVSASTTNTVTNKISIVINGTTYYLLASTSGT
jgi:predicted secreted protein